MARIVPSDWRTVPANGPLARELETLEHLASELPDTLTVFHGVHWTRVDRGTAVFGEIDFVIVAPSGRILLVEQKSGFLAETADGLVKHYAGQAKPVAVQLSRTLNALRARLASLLQPVLAHESVAIDYLLYCPDYAVREPGSAGVPPERIVDAPRRAALAATIVAAFPAAAARPAVAERVRRFFADELALAPDVSALRGRAEALLTRLSGGLAQWARRLEFAPFRLRVIGTAGSGKTQLALAVLRDAQAAGRRALYLCFNRPLADHLARVAPAGTEVATYHQWCDRRLRAAGCVPAYGGAEPFARLEAQLAALDATGEPPLDELVIDEGQDFRAEWVGPLLARVAPTGRVWWLEDPLQNLYGREPVALPGFVVLHAAANYRSPRDLVAALNALFDGRAPIEAAGPVAASGLEVLDYGDTAELIDQTKRAITLALRAGFRPADIALVTFSGRERSRLLPFDALGPHRLRRFLGRYDLLGNPEYSEGELLLETVYRFKGQAAPCVILTEVDFESLDELARRKLFVGLTRASLRQFLVLSQRAADHWLPVAS